MLKKGDIIYYKMCDFDNCKIVKIKIEKIHEEAIECRYVNEKSLSQTKLIFSKKDLGKVIFKLKEKAEKSLQKERKMYPWLV